MRSSSVAIHCRPIRYRRSRATGCCVEMTMKTCSRIWRKSSLRYWSWVRTFSAALPSRRRSASRAASICDSTRVPILTNDSRRLASSLSKVSLGICLAEPARDVSLSALVLGLVEEVSRRRKLDQLPVAVFRVHEHEGGEVRDACGLLHVVRDDHDREVTRQGRHQVFDLQRRDRVEGRARLLHQDHLRGDRYASGAGQTLLLASRKRGRPLVQPVLHLLQQRPPIEAFFDPRPHARLPPTPAAPPQTH